MSTHDLNIANDTNPNVRADLNLALAALGSQQAGTADPSTMYAYERQARTDLGQIRRRNAANSGWVIDATLAETKLIARAADTILAGANHECVIVGTGSFTQTITAAATLGDGWWVGYRNDGSGVIVLDANGSEQIDGATTITLNPGDGCILRCDGTGFKTLGRREIASQADQETGTSTVKAVTPGRQQSHPSAAKAWARMSLAAGSPTLQESYNVSSVTDNGTGDFSFNFTTNFSSSGFIAIGSLELSGGGAYGVVIQARAVGSIRFFLIVMSSGNPTDNPTSAHVACFGDQ